MNVFSRQSGLFALALLLLGSLIAAKFPTATKQYDYVTVVQSSHDNRLSVSTGPTKFEETKYKLDNGKGDANFTPALRKVEELEAQGYELVTNSTHSIGVFPSSYFLLRRPK
jgi:hypothetical protein